MISMKNANWLSTVESYFASMDVLSKDVGQIFNSIKLFGVSLFISISKLWTWLTSLTINPSGLSDIAAFSAGIIALWIPLSTQIITRISDRYNSEVIVRLFERRWENRFLPRIIMGNLLLTILLRLFIPSDNEIFSFEKILAWIATIILIFSCFVLYRSIEMVKIYTYKTDYILKELMDDAEKILQ